MDGCTPIMLRSLFMCGVLGVLLIPVQSQQISVCLEDDEDLRVDCKIKPDASKINTYEFSWSSGSKEVLINTNVTRLAPDTQLREHSEVVELEPHGYRMTLSGYKSKLPSNTTYMCKVSGQIESITVERDNLVTCSAVSWALKSSWSGVVFLLFFLYHTQS
ncbi:thy-1 membrane glycoprotein-like [Cololabis saira]|uniref:thy-1 membrane glycoprotein-like n=1 Tax=Cololabis saira TaxID=129043 RepID=UPI002AD356C0|nr:thy-1 membrane glycoprotein-like [Cololabis saira]